MTLYVYINGAQPMAETDPTIWDRIAKQWDAERLRRDLFGPIDIVEEDHDEA